MNGFFSAITCFISYSHKDKEFVRKLAQSLREKGFIIWFDEKEIDLGEPVWTRIGDGLGKCNAYLIMLSPHSINSPSVMNELELALERRSRDSSFKIIPILLEDCPIPIFLRHDLYLDFRDKSQYGENIERIVLALQNHFNQTGSENMNTTNSEIKTKQARLGEKLKEIQAAGGIAVCSLELLAEVTKLRQEIDRLSQQSAESAEIISDATSESSVYHGIPARIKFIDRPHERRLVEAPLKSKEEWVKNIVIHGMGGTGKTVLAIEVAHAVEAAKLFKQVIWASANDAPITLADLLDIVLRALGHRSDQLTTTQRQNKVMELLRSSSYLLVVDSFERIGDKQVDKFLADGIFFPSKILITTRHIWPQASSIIALDGMTLPQTTKMLKEIGRNLGVTHQFTNSEIATIYETTGGVPLALKLIIGQLAQNIPLQHVITNLTAIDKKSREMLFDNLFGNSWQILPELGQRILMAMTFFAAPASERAIQVISGAQIPNTRHELDELIEMSLLQPHREQMGGDPLRCSIHPLTRKFASDKLKDQTQLKNKIYSTAVSYFVDLIEQLGRPGLNQKSYIELEQDLQNCLAAYDWCRTQKDTQNAFKIVEYLNFFLFEKGYWDTRIEICSKASDLGRESTDNDPKAAWRHSFWAGWVCCRQNNYREARKWLKNAEESFERISTGYRFLIFHRAKNYHLDALITHGEAVEKYKQNIPVTESVPEVSQLFENAKLLYNKAREQFVQYLDSDGSNWSFEEPQYAIAIVDSNQGDLAVDMGHWKNAIQKRTESRQFYQEAQRLYSQVFENAKNSNWQNKDAIMVANAANLGHVEIWLNEKPIEEIRHLFTEALDTAKNMGRIHTIAWCCRGFGLLEQRLSMNEKSYPKKEQYLKTAQIRLKEALDIFEKIGRRQRVEETRESLEEVEAALKELKELNESANG